MAGIKYIALFICIYAGSLNAQRIILSDTIIFSGIIMNAETNEPMGDVTCRRGNNGTISTTAGLFTLNASRGDSVCFSSVGFKPYVVVVPDSLIEPEYIIGVFMSPDTIHLSEAIIIRRYGDSRRQNLMNARNNLVGIGNQAYAPAKDMDAAMNQRMMINKYARSVEMRGHVDVGLGIGTQSLDAYKQLRLQKKMQNQQRELEWGEIDLLKKIYYIEKRRNENN